MERECNAELKTFGISMKLALLGILFTLLTDQIAPSVANIMLPEANNNEQVIEKGSNLTLTCITYGNVEIGWRIPPITRRNEVITKQHHHIELSVEIVLNSSFFLNALGIGKTSLRKHIL